MPYKVDFDPPARPLGNADVTFKVDWNGSSLGTMHVSKGSLVWVPGGHTLGYKVNWKQFASLMAENGTAGVAG